ncbi:acetyltransferase [Ravibacter arvi]|uniref:Acetyltransferase n=1 Tax=Ravibacter arvi TaxID=2051041 RepID=A0ABP8LQF0_9BACT
MRLTYQLLGYLIGKVCRYRSSVSLQNLARAMPAASYADILQYQTTFYRNLSRVLIENIFYRLPKLRVTPESLALLRKKDMENRSMVLLLGHYGNWEVLNSLPLWVNSPVQALYKPLKNKTCNSLIKTARQRNGLRLLPAHGAARTLLSERGRPGITLFIADQFPGHRNGLQLDFLNQPTYMFTGAEQLAKRLGAYVGYVELRPLSGHEWEMSLQTICENAAETSSGTITTAYAQKLEKSIRQNPDWWLWTHKRWK